MEASIVTFISSIISSKLILRSILRAACGASIARATGVYVLVKDIGG